MLKPSRKSPPGRQFTLNHRQPQNTKYQAGTTLVEAMISITISLVITTAMVVLMANSLGTSTRIIKMSQLTDELRNTMSVMSRDVRRANYSAHSIYCYSNSDCGVDGSATQSGDIAINNNNDCFTFQLDRDWDGDASNDEAGGFRLVTSNSIGVIEMWVGDSSPDCNASHADWLEITEPTLVDITAYSVNDAQSFTGTIIEEGGTTVSQRTRQIRLIVAGALVRDESITRRIEHTIRVRNDFFL